MINVAQAPGVLAPTKGPELLKQRDCSVAATTFRHPVSSRQLVTRTTGPFEPRVPAWQKRGIGLYWEEVDRPAENPVTGEKVLARRRRIRRDLELPMKDDYSAFLRQRIAVSQE